MLSPRRDSYLIEKSAKHNGIRSTSCNSVSQFPPPTVPPAIRVIHIFSPKVIKTDAAHFRELVQKLTGKSKKKPNKRRRSGICEDYIHSRRSMTSKCSTTLSDSAESTSDQSLSARTFESSSLRTSALCSSPDAVSSSSAAIRERFFGLSPSLSSCRNINQSLSSEITTALRNFQSCTSTTRSFETCSGDVSSGNFTTSSGMVDPLQSLSGYKDNWASSREFLADSSGSFSFSGGCSDYNARTTSQDTGTSCEQMQLQLMFGELQTVKNNYNVSTVSVNDLKAVTGHSCLKNSYSEWDVAPTFSLHPLAGNIGVNASLNDSVASYASEESYVSSQENFYAPDVKCRF